MINPETPCGCEPLEYQKLSVPGPYRPGRRVSWGALLAGATAAPAVQALLMMAGTAAGLAVFSPREGDDPHVRFGYGALAVHTVCAWIALGTGGWVAGHFASVTARVHAWLHGFTVWAILMVAGAVTVTLGVGKLAGGLADAVGEGLAGVAKAAGPVVNAAVGELKKDDGDLRTTLAGFVDEVLPRGESEAVRRASPQARRELVAAVARRYGSLAGPADDAGKNELVDAVVAAGLSGDDAVKTVEGWDRFTARTKADFEAFARRTEAKARDVADEAAYRSAIVSGVAFAAFLIGAAAAAFGACCGAKCAKRREEKCAR